MVLTDLLATDAIIPSLRAHSKKAAIQELCDRASTVSGLPGKELVEAVLQREKLGSTGVGKGIAIPHGKVTACGRIFGVFARLERPIDFDALDGEPVDLAFLLVAPESAGAEHLKALASIARLLRQPHVTAKLRVARDAAAIRSIMNDTPASHAA